MNHIDYEINKELGECYLFMAEYEKAREYYQKAVACNPGAQEPYMGLAAITLNDGDLSAAYTLYKKAYSVQAGEKPLIGLAMIEQAENRLGEAFGHYSEALGYNPGNMIAVNSLMQIAYVQNRLEEIIPYLEAALEPGDTEAVRYALAGCLLTIGRESEAKAHLEMLLGSNPANAEAQQLYAHFAA